MQNTNRAADRLERPRLPLSLAISLTLVIVSRASIHKITNERQDKRVRQRERDNSKVNVIYLLHAMRDSLKENMRKTQPRELKSDSGKMGNAAN